MLTSRFALSNVARYSAFLCRLPATGSVTEGEDTLTLRGDGPALNVIDLDPSALTRVNRVRLFATPGSTVLVNLRGDSITVRSVGFEYHGIDASHVLFNLPEALTVEASNVGLRGTVLAPLADVTFSDGDVFGSLIASSLVGNVKASVVEPGHPEKLVAFQGCLPVP